MLIDEKINSLQNLIKRKITYEELAPILGVESGNAIIITSGFFDNIRSQITKNPTSVKMQGLRKEDLLLEE